jgi:hypothetical protein
MPAPTSGVRYALACPPKERVLHGNGSNAPSTSFIAIMFEKTLPKLFEFLYHAGMVKKPACKPRHPVSLFFGIIHSLPYCNKKAEFQFKGVAKYRINVQNPATA